MNVKIYMAGKLLSTKLVLEFLNFRYNEAVVKQILLKTMMMAPKSDYALAKYLIDSSRVGSPVGFLEFNCVFLALSSHVTV